MFSFFKRKPKEEPVITPEVVATQLLRCPTTPPAPQTIYGPATQPVATPPVPVTEAVPETVPAAQTEQKRSWLSRLKAGLAKTSSNLTTLFIGARIDDRTI
jgi:fused signal recognition particle receptor